VGGKRFQPETLNPKREFLTRINAKDAKFREREGNLEREPAFAKATADATRNLKPQTSSFPPA